MTYEVIPSGKLAHSTRFNSVMCKTCDKETPHRLHRCIYCKTLSNDPFIQKMADLKEERKKMPFNQWLYKMERERAQRSRDKREAFRRAAEESRKKWEKT